MKKLDSYLLREMVVPFLIGTVAVVLMFQANTYIFLAKTLDLKNVPIKAVLQYIYFQTPMYLNMTLAVGMSLGSSLALSRIARESELTAIRAAGVRIMRTLAPVMVFGAFVGVGNYYLAEKIMPPMARRATVIGNQIGVLGLAAEYKENAVINLRDFTANFGVVRKIGTDKLDIEEAWLFRQRGRGEEEVFYAKTGKYERGIWTFKDARVRRFKNGLDVVDPATAAKVTINQRILTEGMFNPIMPEEQTAQQLKDQIDVAKKNHMETKQLEVKLHTRYSVPAACLVFSLVGPVFAIYFARSGGFVGVLLSIVMVLLYYNAFVISTEILSKVPTVPSWFAAWLPNLLFTVLGVFAIRRLE